MCVCVWEGWRIQTCSCIVFFIWTDWTEQLPMFVRKTVRVWWSRPLPESKPFSYPHSSRELNKLIWSRQNWFYYGPSCGAWEPQQTLAYEASHKLAGDTLPATRTSAGANSSKENKTSWTRPTKQKMAHNAKWTWIECCVFVRLFLMLLPAESTHANFVQTDNNNVWELATRETILNSWMGAKRIHTTFNRYIGVDVMKATSTDYYFKLF